MGNCSIHLINCLAKKSIGLYSRNSVLHKEIHQQWPQSTLGQKYLWSWLCEFNSFDNCTVGNIEEQETDSIWKMMTASLAGILGSFKISFPGIFHLIYRKRQCFSAYCQYFTTGLFLHCFVSLKITTTIQNWLCSWFTFGSDRAMTIFGAFFCPENYGHTFSRAHI